MDREVRLAEAKVGVFVVAAVAIFVIISLWIAGSTLLRGSTVLYTVLLPHSGGIGDGDRVRVAGVDVGRIKNIRLRPGEAFPVTIRVALDPEVAVHEGATAVVASAGLLGSYYLEIDLGPPDAPLLPSGSQISGRETLGFDAALARVGDLSDGALELMDKTGGILDQISGRIGPILTKLEAFLAEENAEAVKDTLAALRQTLDDNGPRLSRLLENLESTSVKLDDGLDGLPELVERINTLAGDLQTALGPDGERLAGVLVAAEDSLSSAHSVLAVVEGNKTELDATLHDLREAVGNLRDLSQLLKERPFSLVRIKPEPERSPGEGAKEKGR